MALPKSFEDVVYVKWTADVDADMGWVTDAVTKCNGIVADYWVNVQEQAIHTTSDGTPIEV